jgi:hypothetical protein
VSKTKGHSVFIQLDLNISLIKAAAEMNALYGARWEAIADC